MEMFSNNFKMAAKSLFDSPKTTVICTIPIAKGKPIPFVEDVRARRDARLFTVCAKSVPQAGQFPRW